MGHRRYKIGEAREQGFLLPPRVEDYVGSDNPVRAIEAYVRSLDLGLLGFQHTLDQGGAGQPAYDPSDLLKLYLYGYLNQIRSSRRIERECGRNVELIWLLRGLVPGYRTIANFRKDNAAALKLANREFVLLLRKLNLLGGELVAIDGAFFHGDAAKGSIVTKKKLVEQLAQVDREIEAYAQVLDTNDTMEAAAPAPRGGDVAADMAALIARGATLRNGLASLEASGETQLSGTDPDARLLTKNGQGIAGFNVQIAVDAKHKLIVASDVVNDGNDTGQLHALASAAQAALGVDRLQAVADVGYYNGETLKACEADGIEAYVPSAERGIRLERQNRFALKQFTYDAAADLYRCPAGQELRRTPATKRDASGKLLILYSGPQKTCRKCPLRSRCLTDKAKRRIIYRWEHEAVIDRHRARMAADKEISKRRRELAEHPFGTIKCKAGYRHFLVRGFAKVRGEWSLMALCYNLTRVMNILGIKQFIARLRNWLFAWLMVTQKTAT